MTHKDYNPMDDSELEFQTVYADYRPRILRYLARLVGELEAEDLTQEVFVKVSRALPTFRGESQLSTWVYRIATNAALDKMRTSAFRHETDAWNDLDETQDQDAWTGEQAPSLEQFLMRKEMYECFQEFVEALPENYRTVVVLSELEAMTNHEIAEILELSLEVVKIRLHRGRARLIQELKTRCRPEEWLPEE